MSFKLAFIVVFCLLATQALAIEKSVVDVESKETVVCTICLYVVNYVEEYIQNNATEQKIIEALSEVCKIFPIFQQQCEDFIRTETPALIQLILNQLPPQVVCDKIKACNANTTEIVKLVEVAPLKKLTPPKDSGLCSICELAVQAIEGWLAQNATEQQIIVGLEKICSALPDTIVGPCNAFVEQYTPLAIQWILTNQPPSVFCTELSLCSSNKFIKKSLPTTGFIPKTAVKRAERMLYKPTAVRSGELCSICELVVSSIEQWLQQNTTEAQIIENVQNICKQLPDPLSGYCNAFAEQYVPLAIQYIVNNYPPAIFCTNIGLCTDNSVISNKRMHKIARV